MEWQKLHRLEKLNLTTLLKTTLKPNMVSQRLSTLSAVRKQHLLVELYGLLLSAKLQHVANSHSQLESQVRLSPRRIYEPDTRGPNTLVRRNIRTERSPFSLSVSIPKSVLTAPRTPRPCDTPLPNLLPPNLPLPPPSRDLQHRHLPPAHHTPHNIHVYDRYPGLGHCVGY